MPNTYNYLCALTYVDFDNENKDVIYFKNLAAKESYFNLSTLFNNAIEINFEKKNLIDVDVVIPLSNTDIIKNEFGFNYCIIKEISTGDYYFYFVNKQNYLNNGRMSLKCHLDVFTTYFDKLVIEGVINRATLREFIKDGSDAIYDTRGYTHVFSVDDTYNGKKFLQYEKVLQPHVFTYLDAHSFDTWLNDNIECWEYAFVDSTHTYNNKFVGTITSYRNVDEFLSYQILCSYGVIVQPIYKTNNKMYIKFTDVSDPDNPVVHIMPFSENAFDTWRKFNNDNSYVYSTKLSKQPPFNPITSATDSLNFSVALSINNDLYFDFGNITSINDIQLIQAYTRVYFNVIDTDDSKCQLLFEFTGQVRRFYNNNLSLTIVDYLKTRMTLTKYLSNSTEFWKYPNATSLKNVELKITYNGQEYSTTPSKIDTSAAKIEMLETINPDITKIYVRWEPTGYYAFRSYNSKTLTGGIFSDDTSLSLGTSKLQEILANSKNFFMQKRVNIGANSLLNLATNTAKMDVVGVAKSLAKEQLNEINYGYEVDNIENAPSHLEKASGNVLFNLLSKPYGLHFELWMMTEEDLSNIAFYYNKYGVQTNTYGQILDVLEKHKYFDYAEFDASYIHDGNSGTVLKITNEIKEEIKRKLKRGVRFWYDGTKLYYYNGYNYEKAME